jgi:hypothetical protein
MVADPLGFIIIVRSLGGRDGPFCFFVSLSAAWILLINQIRQPFE